MKKGHIRLERRICLYFFVKNKAVAGRYQRRAVKEYKRISSCLVRGGICVIVKEIFNVGDFIMPQPFLSVLILTKNNQRSINYALMSVQPYADEIIVLDSGSQDKTLEIANRYTDKIYFREFELRENYFITLRECCKWKVRQAATSLRVALKF